MARPFKKTVDYFPHSAIPGKTLFKIESRWGNDGYAFFFKLLELLCQTNGHLLDYGNSDEKDFIIARAKVSEITADEILNKLAEWGNIDPELWSYKKIWCQNLVDNIKDAYKKRLDQYPKKPVTGAGNPSKTEFSEPETPINGVTGAGNGESKVKESKVKESKGEVEARFIRPQIVEEMETDFEIVFFQKYSQESPEYKIWFPDRIYLEAQKCFDHYSANGWKQTGGLPIKDYYAMIRNWMRNSERFQSIKNKF